MDQETLDTQSSRMNSDHDSKEHRMYRNLKGIIAFSLTLVVLGLNQPTSSLAAPEPVRAPVTAEDLGLGHAQPAVRMGGASGGVLYHIGDEIPQTV
jgi:hypothetical protein